MYIYIGYYYFYYLLGWIHAFYFLGTVFLVAKGFFLSVLALGHLNLWADFIN
jgi:hypothetical protein